MKKTIFTFSVLLCTALSFSLFASPDGEHTEMEKSMERMDDAYKDLRRALRGASAENKAEYQALMSTMIKEAKASREWVPKKLAPLPEAEQAKAMVGFQKEMDGMITELERIADLLEKEQFDDAGTALRGLRTYKSEGHEKYRLEE